MASSRGVDLNFTSNLDAIDELAGMMDGLERSFNNDEYIDSLAQAAHDKATLNFDVDAAARASAGFFSHMYEFGTAGITRGPVRVSEPTSAQARLWVHDMAGRGGTYNIGFNYRPAIIPNPQPTTKDTGVPSKYLKRLSRRRYIFWNKAFVTEMGKTVEIGSNQEHGLLFVPFGPGNGRGSKTYMMWHAPSRGPIKSVPGATQRGMFTAFWEAWWETTGDSMMTDYIAEEVDEDVRLAMAESARRAAAMPLKPATPSRSNAVANNASVKTQSVMTKKSKARKGRSKRR